MGGFEYGDLIGPWQSAPAGEVFCAVCELGRSAVRFAVTAAVSAARFSSQIGVLAGSPPLDAPERPEVSGAGVRGNGDLAGMVRKRGIQPSVISSSPSMA